MNKFHSPKAVLFDVFGTVVDWRSSVAEQLAAFGNKHEFKFNAEEFTDRWRQGFRVLQKKIAQGETGWMTMDEIHRNVLDQLLLEENISDIEEAELVDLNRAWHRLRPWPDAVAGLQRIKQGHIISPLSNGNLSMLVAVAKFAALPWDCVLSTAMFASYKPDPKVYLGAAELLGLSPDQVMLVAAHAYDCDGAAAAGLQTAYVHRPDEFGPGRGEDPGDTARFDVTVRDFLELADALAAHSGQQ